MKDIKNNDIKKYIKVYTLKQASHNHIRACGAAAAVCEADPHGS